MVSKIDLAEMLLKNFPKFKKILEKEIIETWRGEANDSILMIEFSRYIKNMIEKNYSDNRKDIELAFKLAEKFIVEGDNSVKDAVATCFLENLINAVAWERIPASSFLDLLGKESRKYCKAWDEFTGVKTPGL